MVARKSSSLGSIFLIFAERHLGSGHLGSASVHLAHGQVPARRDGGACVDWHAAGEEERLVQTIHLIGILDFIDHCY